jgi:hypothetical protein
VGQLAGRLGLEEEALVVVLAALLVVGEQDGLEGHDAVERRVLGAIDDAHRAAAELAEQLVPADLPELLLRH